MVVRATGDRAGSWQPLDDGASVRRYVLAKALSRMVVGVPTGSMFPLTVKERPRNRRRSPQATTARSGRHCERRERGLVTASGI